MQIDSRWEARVRQTVRRLTLLVSGLMTQQYCRGVYGHGQKHGVHRELAIRFHFNSPDTSVPATPAIST